MNTAGHDRVTKLEELSINAWPSLQTMLYDGWVLRFSEGHTKRANSSNPLYGGLLGVDEKIDACEKLYSGRHLDTVFKLTAASYPPDLDRVLSARGYVLESGSAVQTLDLQNDIAEPEEPDITLSSDASDEWLSAFWQMSGFDERRREIAKQMLLNVVPQKCLASISESESGIIACGMAVLQGDYVGLFNIVTHKDFRRRGHGKQLTLGLLHWARENGARLAYLQV
ncbi:MAG: GNAT family N-acetyltransferase [Thaumarchaeota archaeon]|nr:GNAT family N-acetyltransferase [Nitrososphaerota archaeon]